MSVIIKWLHIARFSQIFRVLIGRTVPSVGEAVKGWRGRLYHLARP